MPQKKEHQTLINYNDTKWKYDEIGTKNYEWSPTEIETEDEGGNEILAIYQHLTVNFMDNAFDNICADELR